MLFNSIQFVLFFLLVYCLYLMLNHKWQNRILLAASYFFYALWDWRFLSLILISTTVDYFCGIKIDEAEDIKKKKIFLYTSLFVNLSILGFFKYFNFFSYNLQVLLKIIGFSLQPHFFHIVLPLGISFYTFRTLNYIIDIYWEQMKPTKSFLDYALFVAFFPTILSGPIDRARNFIPQITLHRKLTLDKFYEGCFLILWGLVQKVVIADNIGKLVDPVFSASQPYDGIVILITSYFYVLQLYCDFAGYSNIAIGLGKVLGFDIMINFNFPLFAVNIADFWRRWHISLSTWVRDYIYTPLFLSLRNIKGNKRLSLSLIITMASLGLWHGAGWTFVVYGLYHGILLAVYQQIQPKISNIVKKRKPINQNISLILRVVFMFHITAIGFLIFRAHSLTQVYEMLYGLIFNFKVSDIFMIKNILERVTLFLIIFLSVGLITFEIVQFRKNNQLIVFRWCTLGRSVFYIVCIYLILFYGVEGGSEFIYAQF